MTEKFEGEIPQHLEKKQERVSENPLGKRYFKAHQEVLRKDKSGEQLTPEEDAELNALNEFVHTGNVRAVELAKKEKLGELTTEEDAELVGHRVFKGNTRIAELHKKKILDVITDGEKEEYELSKELYYAEAGGEKLWRTHPELYERKEQLKKQNTEKP